MAAQWGLENVHRCSVQGRLGEAQDYQFRYPPSLRQPPAEKVSHHYRHRLRGDVNTMRNTCF